MWLVLFAGDFLPLKSIYMSFSAELLAQVITLFDKQLCLMDFEPT